MRALLLAAAISLVSCVPRVSVPPTKEGSLCLRDCGRLRNECIAAHGCLASVWVVSMITDEMGCSDQYEDCAGSCGYAAQQAAATDEQEMDPRLNPPPPAAK
jgi:hypothetical protein